MLCIQVIGLHLERPVSQPASREDVSLGLDPFYFAEPVKKTSCVGGWAGS